jgi:hypothetical protein
MVSEQRDQRIGLRSCDTRNGSSRAMLSRDRLQAKPGGQEEPLHAVDSDCPSVCT